MVLHKRIKRVLFESKAQYFGSIVLILFSSFMLTLMGHFALNFEQLANSFQSSYLQEDAAFATSAPINNLPELEAATGSVIEEGRSLDATLADGKTLRVFTQNEKVNLPAIIEGSDLSRSGDILISPTFASANGYRIGDELKILDHTYTITGFVALPHFMYPLQSEDMLMYTNDFGFAVIGKQDFSTLGQGNSFYAVKYSQGAQSALTQAVQFKETLSSRGIEITQWTDIENNRRVNIVAMEVTVLKIMSRAVPGGILILVSIMVGNAIGRMISREASIIGALYALGYRRREIYRHYLVFPLLIGVAGGTVGTLLGLLPIRTAVQFMLSVFIIPLTGIRLNPLVIVLSLFLPILFLGTSSFLVIRRELKHSPVELMRGKEENYNVNVLERALKLGRLPFSLKFKIREQLRSLSRVAFLLAGVIVATMLLLWGLALKSGFDYMLTQGLTETYQFVYEYKFDQLRSDALPAGAEPASSALFLPQGEENRDFYVTGVQPDSAVITLVDKTGAGISTDQVVATRPLADQLQVKAGETANIVRKVDGRVFSVQIDSIAETYSGKILFLPLSEYNATFGQPQGSYNGAFSNVVLDIPEDQSYSVVTLDKKIAGIREAIAPTQGMIAFLATVAFFIGMIVIYVVTSMMVEENKRSISLMKILGYHKREINSLILNSSTIVVVAGYLLGIPLILAALGAILKMFEDSIGLSMPPGRIDLVYLVVGFVMVMVSYELSKWLCRKKVNAVSMSEVLKSGME
jgi:putative ABC transport system permease protein